MREPKRPLTEDEMRKANAARAEYYRSYRERNRERLKQNSLRYWLNKAKDTPQEGEKA